MAHAQLTRGQTEQLELAAGDIVHVKWTPADARPRTPTG
jgi:hypothetical protein